MQQGITRNALYAEYFQIPTYWCSYVYDWVELLHVWLMCSIGLLLNKGYWGMRFSEPAPTPVICDGLEGQFDYWTVFEINGKHTLQKTIFVLFSQQ